MKSSSIYVTVRALVVENNHNGTFTLELPGKELLPEQSRVLEELFPNLTEAAYKLLNQEALLAALATPSEIGAEPKKDEKESGKPLKKEGVKKPLGYDTEDGRPVY